MGTPPFSGLKRQWPGLGVSLLWLILMAGCAAREAPLPEQPALPVSPPLPSVSADLISVSLEHGAALITSKDIMDLYA